MKEHLEELLSQSLLHLQREGVLPGDAEFKVQLERTRSPEHGEFASNVAMVLAKAAGLPPRKLAEAIISRVPMSRQVDRMEIAGPGFLNLYFRRGLVLQQLLDPSAVSPREASQLKTIIEGLRAVPVQVDIKVVPVQDDGDGPIESIEKTPSKKAKKREKKMIWSMSMFAMDAKGFRGMMLKRMSWSPGGSSMASKRASLVPE